MSGGIIRGTEVLLLSALLIVLTCHALPLHADAWAGTQSGKMKAGMKIGVIYNGDPNCGSGYSYEHAQGIERMRKKLRLKEEQIIIRSNISENDEKAIDEAFGELADSGCMIIFATSNGFKDMAEKYADKYPDRIFSVCSGNINNGRNLNSYFGKLYEARYLSGIAAGMNTKSDRVGFVAAKGTESSEVTGSADAFAMGVYSVNSNCQVLLEVTHSWNSPELEKQAALDLIGEGCDVIAQHCDSPSAQITAAKAGVCGIGYNSDMSKISPDSVLTSVVWDWSVYYKQAVGSLLSGRWKCDDYYGGIEDNAVAITALSDFCRKGTDKAVVKAWNDIIDGKEPVFYGQLETNDGSLIGYPGRMLSDEEIKTGINWYFKNIRLIGSDI